ncbi:MAG TPA: PLDc N-terminal domain-containing protein [Candidatus Agrococcus pullicola]|uniref:PLDc N-terminal domain-containing protein n=1 Tax=Candidatus Agrococcus pullicola TaxID=2838429 RepID=A0A9D2C8J5_9MICO|nr:PLDc N-terminal domain-containing protein [Candidatus Agrococcus pullicola]
MARAILAGILVAVVLLIYSLIDLTVTDDARIRRLNRVLWIVIIVVIPIFGPLAWVLIGKGPRSMGTVVAKDDEPSSGESGPSISDEEADRRIREIEEQLEALEAEEAAERAAREAAAEDEEDHDDSETNNGNGTSDATGKGERPGA